MRKRWGFHESRVHHLQKVCLRQQEFHGYPFVYDSVAENNQESINLIFSENPIATCKRYNLIWFKDILGTSQNKI